MSNANPYPAPAPEPVSRVDRYLQRIVDRTVPPVTWRDYQHRVRAGTVGSFVKAGDKLDVNIDGVAKAFDVEGIDEEAPVAPGLDHCLSLIPRLVLFNLPFDPAQFLFAVTEEACRYYGWDPAVGMPPGYYCLTLDHGGYRGENTGQDGTYSFRTPVPVPVGGGITHSTMGYLPPFGPDHQRQYTMETILSGSFEIYGRYINFPSESASTIEGAVGTNLGTTTYNDPQYKSGAFLNFTKHQAYGSGRWSTSWLRQWLNSDEDIFRWTRATIWSRPPAVRPSVTKGFLRMLDPDLRAVLGKVRKRYALSISDGYGYEDVEDYVTLATMLDVDFGPNGGISEGPVRGGEVRRTTAMSLWQGATPADRKKNDGVAYESSWWLGSACLGYNQYDEYEDRACAVTGAGYLGYSEAYKSTGVVPHLHII